MHLILAEIFEELKKKKTENKKKEFVLEQKNNKKFLQLIQYAYHDKLVFLLPKGIPPYKPSELPEDMTYQELNERVLKKDFPVFLGGAGYDNMKQIKREQKFIELLEVIHSKDAKLVCAVKDKDLTEFGITKAQAHKWLPELFNINVFIL